mmetsp:Transcript_10308/g.29347  ORF Transcript_10308/g.29347 Transcript_10308/m.29347 type:complete len:308 (-) Transcript_10308:147-1070(-)
MSSRGAGSTGADPNGLAGGSTKGSSGAAARTSGLEPTGPVGPALARGATEPTAAQVAPAAPLPWLRGACARPPAIVRTWAAKSSSMSSSGSPATSNWSMAARWRSGGSEISFRMLAGLSAHFAAKVSCSGFESDLAWPTGLLAARIFDSQKAVNRESMSWDSPCGSNMASTVRRTPGFIVAHFASLRSPSDHFALKAVQSSSAAEMLSAIRWWRFRYEVNKARMLVMPAPGGLKSAIACACKKPGNCCSFSTHGASRSNFFAKAAMTGSSISRPNAPSPTPCPFSAGQRSASSSGGVAKPSRAKGNA